MNTDQIEVGTNGHKLSLSKQSSSGNFFLFVLAIMASFFLLFCFFIDPLVAFIVGVLILLGIIIYSCIMFYLHPENFNTSEVWLKYMTLKLGDKQSGLREPSTDGELVQPILMGEPISDSTRIKKGDTK